MSIDIYISSISSFIINDKGKHKQIICKLHSSVISRWVKENSYYNSLLVSNEKYHRKRDVNSLC